MPLAFACRGPLALPAGGWTPASIPGILGWYEADTGVTTSSGNVTAVNDLSGNSNNLVNSGTVPFNATSAYNSKPAFDFVAANGAALIKSSFPIGTGTDASAFFIGQMSSSTDNFGGAITYGDGANNDFNGTGGMALLTRTGTTSSFESDRLSNAIDTAVSTGTNARFGIVFQGVIARLTHYLNNSAGGTLDITGPANWTNNGTLVIGNRYLGSVGGGAWQGPICAIVITNSIVGSSDRGLLDTYWTGKWGT